MTAGLSRRQLFSGGVGLSALAMAGCTSTRDSVPVDRDTTLRTAAAERERVLVAAYDAALLRAAPAETARLAPLRAEHVVHLTALDLPLPSATASATPYGPVPDLPALRALERATAADHAVGAITAGRALAGVLASLSASEASHAVALR